MSTPPLIAHLIYRLDFGGLETMLVERINRIPADRYRHAVICLTDYTDFHKKITKPGVALFSLNKASGLSLGTHRKLWRLLRELKPDILHTYNLAAAEYGATAALAGVPVRISGSHGRDASDPEGKNRKHNLLRKALIPFYDCCYSNSADLAAWNKNIIGVPEAKSRLLHNGIDTSKYKPGIAPSGAEYGDIPAGSFVIGTVGRVQDVKDHPGLVDAFIALRAMLPEYRGRLRLAIIGDGPLMPALREKVAAAGIVDKVWLPGARTDVAQILRTFSVFVLSSIAEGTPGSALEAMATRLPVVGTRVGGIPEVVQENVTGQIVPSRDPNALAQAIAAYVEKPELAAHHGAAGLERVTKRYSMASMLDQYLEMYDSLFERKIKVRELSRSCAE
ncbi:MAG TPA: TIGR03088 family PEP-CTERM/XrtA system glycosyltransferase [Noviherbaspirillum sp.]|jgi:sugar transferase (PEP-CTERM/EpsH1 system associated)|uniref:TIGR03088 family PEP-CTERM/XrtA system glycosyltransferase n=1 Tax=Noviherbaspirillum sp. TaxID=1926288 RepID=UPI002DDD30B0|nr:TIGR03088 family PEP-CTERM/XrtA system glycosyltransferase [Noviherbaspirillum sp.]HEV2608900.1 TIGR03088 family PEP-CTERM/XrtA system glycosyltransferase [Noviherbaspirillum sp.]